MTINSNRLTIIVEDGTVIIDTSANINLDFSSCGIPESIHAFQWMNDSGEIEYNGAQSNEKVISIPDWAYNCYNVLISSANTG